MFCLLLNKVIDHLTGAQCGNIRNLPSSTSKKFREIGEINLQYDYFNTKVTLTEFSQKSRGGKFFKLPQCGGMESRFTMRNFKFLE